MEKAYDMEIVLFYINHIDNPCVEPITGKNIRDFYIREAKTILPKLKNQFAFSLLESKIKEYETCQI